MPSPSHRWPFLLFVLSGFSGLVYQIVWLRLAFAAFGVLTPVLSVVLSVFMLGLGVGAWLAGWMAGRYGWSQVAALRVYAATELLIGIGGFAVPLLFNIGATTLWQTGETNSTEYLVSSAAMIAATLIPFCVLMGATLPLMMQALGGTSRSRSSFSFLYLANVLGAMLGTFLAPAAIIELLGFRGTLWVATIANWTVAAISLALSLRGGIQLPAEPQSASESSAKTAPMASQPSRLFALVTLFVTGLASMGMEVVWTRAFTPTLRTQVYSFASLLFVYFVATWLGSACYRRRC
jgi:spermidine synthase